MGCLPLPSQIVGPRLWFKRHAALHRYHMINLLTWHRILFSTCPTGALILITIASQGQAPGSLLMHPDHLEMNRPAPEISRVRLETTKGIIRLELRRAWAPHGVDRFFNLVGAG